MACGAKTVETRHWYTHIRGEVYIHAAQTREGIKSLHPLTAVKIEDALGMTTDEMFRKLPFGELVCYGDLYDCIYTQSALLMYPSQEHFGDFTAGRYGHIYKNIEEVLPIPLRGSRSRRLVAIVLNTLLTTMTIRHIQKMRLQYLPHNLATRPLLLSTQLLNSPHNVPIDLRRNYNLIAHL